MNRQTSGCIRRVMLKQIPRSGGTVDFGVPLEALLRLDVEKFAPDALPDWLAAIPLTERGSTKHLKP